MGCGSSKPSTTTGSSAPAPKPPSPKPTAPDSLEEKGGVRAARAPSVTSSSGGGGENGAKNLAKSAPAVSSSHVTAAKSLSAPATSHEPASKSALQSLGELKSAKNGGESCTAKFIMSA